MSDSRLYRPVPVPDDELDLRDLIRLSRPSLPPPAPVCGQKSTPTRAGRPNRRGDGKTFEPTLKTEASI